jgi:tRNA-Thr(GGU) m(6)t(6)A37 methyltransferase TsaA
MKITFQPNGAAHSSFKEKKDLDGFSHIIMIFAFHKSGERHLCVHPPFDARRRGVFSTRSANRPNPIGLIVPQLVGRDKNILSVRGMGLLEGTPLLDIKPYTPRDLKPDAQFGWREKFTT